MTSSLALSAQSKKLNLSFFFLGLCMWWCIFGIYPNTLVPHSLKHARYDNCILTLRVSVWLFVWCFSMLILKWTGNLSHLYPTSCLSTTGIGSSMRSMMSYKHEVSGLHSFVDSADNMTCQLLSAVSYLLDSRPRLPLSSVNLIYVSEEWFRLCHGWK